MSLWEEDRSVYCTNSLFKCYLPVTWWAKLGEGRAGEAGGDGATGGGGGGQGRGKGGVRGVQEDAPKNAKTAKSEGVQKTKPDK